MSSIRVFQRIARRSATNPKNGGTAIYGHLDGTSNFIRKTNRLEWMANILFLESPVQQRPLNAVTFFTTDWSGAEFTKQLYGWNFNLERDGLVDISWIGTDHFLGYLKGIVYVRCNGMGVSEYFTILWNFCEGISSQRPRTVVPHCGVHAKKMICKKYHFMPQVKTFVGSLWETLRRESNWMKTTILFNLLHKLSGYNNEWIPFQSNIWDIEDMRQYHKYDENQWIKATNELYNAKIINEDRKNIIKYDLLTNNNNNNIFNIQYGQSAASSVAITNPFIGTNYIRFKIYTQTSKLMIKPLNCPLKIEIKQNKFRILFETRDFFSYPWNNYFQFVGVWHPQIFEDLGGVWQHNQHSEGGNGFMKHVLFEPFKFCRAPLDKACIIIKEDQQKSFENIVKQCKLGFHQKQKKNLSVMAGFTKARSYKPASDKETIFSNELIKFINHFGVTTKSIITNFDIEKSLKIYGNNIGLSVFGDNQSSTINTKINKMRATKHWTDNDVLLDKLVSWVQKGQSLQNANQLRLFVGRAQ